MRRSLRTRSPSRNSSGAARNAAQLRQIRNYVATAQSVKSMTYVTPQQAKPYYWFAQSVNEN